MSENDKSILAEAEELINGQRLQDYGDPSKMFTKLAAMYSVATGQKVSAGDAVLFLCILKLVRLKNSGYQHRDSLVDAAGYLGLIEKISNIC